MEDRDIKIVLADDHEIVRVGIKRLLSMDKSLKVLDEAPNGDVAIKLVAYHNPDIALLDIQMPIMDGIEAATKIKADMPHVFVVMLTAFEDYPHVEKALTAGADGYLSKDIGSKDLISALHTIMHGERVFSRSIIKLLQKRYPETGVDASPVIISKREQEILNLVAIGKTSKEIADKLFLSIRTVESHRYNVMQKLGIKNAAGLARYALSSQSILK
ncbi:MAG: two component transcriptional regulator, LuxR family [Ignavibacteria bacterium]|nr:two component transcriptional regulator, LuxR family [Ignavibacteria bacterium]